MEAKKLPSLCWAAPNCCPKRSSLKLSSKAFFQPFPVFCQPLQTVPKQGLRVKKGRDKTTSLEGGKKREPEISCFLGLICLCYYIYIYIPSQTDLPKQNDNPTFTVSSKLAGGKLSKLPAKTCQNYKRASDKLRTTEMDDPVKLTSRQATSCRPPNNKSASGNWWASETSLQGTSPRVAKDALHQCARDPQRTTSTCRTPNP